MHSVLFTVSSYVKKMAWEVLTWTPRAEDNTSGAWALSPPVITLSSSRAPSGSGVQATGLPIPQGCVCVWLLVVSDSCNRIDCSLPGSAVRGILQARILEWVAISCSRGSSQPRNRTQVSCTADRFFTNWVMREPYPRAWSHLLNQLLCAGTVLSPLPTLLRQSSWVKLTNYKAIIPFYRWENQNRDFKLFAQSASASQKRKTGSLWPFRVTFPLQWRENADETAA